MSNLTVAVMFTKTNGDEAATGLTLTDIALYLTAYKVSDGSTTVVWDGTQNPTEEVDNIGCYARVYTSADLNTYEYFAKAVYSGATTLDQDTVQGAVSSIAAVEIADETLKRGVSNVEDSANATSLAALVLAAFESAISGATWTIYKTDHSTTFTTRTVTTDSSADPITEVT